jgi:hypothetical protein
MGDVKGADLLAALKGRLSKTAVPDPPPAAQHSPAPPATKPAKVNAGKWKNPFLGPGALVAQKSLSKKKAEAAKKSGITVIKPRNEAERRAYRAAQTACSSVPAARAAPRAAVPDFGAAAFHKLTSLREKMDGFRADHRGPGEVPPADRDIVLRRIEAGAAAVPGIIHPEDGYFIGYDFGTSTTKVVARNPNGGVHDAFAIDVPRSIASDGQPHLFPTAVWWDKAHDRFALTPGEGLIRLDSFKTALIEGRGHRVHKQSGLLMEIAATAFVALHLAYCIGAALEEMSDFTLDLVNVGIPVAVFEGQGSVAAFQRVLDAAMRLVGRSPDFSSGDVQNALKSTEELPIKVVTHAELSGAIAGYCSATRHWLGGHMIIDCGSATFDVVTFDLDQRTHRPIGVYGARVENLGADACSLYIRSGINAEDCRKAAQFVEHLVYVQTLENKRSLFCYDKGSYPYQIILIGGGIKSDVHAPLLETMAGAFDKPFHHPKIAQDLDYDDGCDPSRLILADGLARDPVLLREIALPKPPLPPKWEDPVAPGPEQC